MSAPTVDVARWGDWDRPAAQDVPADLVAPLDRWLHEGGPITDPALAALVHRKVLQTMAALLAAVDVVDRVRDEAHDRYRRAVEPLAGPVRLSETYERGFGMGQTVALDAEIADLARVRDALSMVEP